MIAGHVYSFVFVMWVLMILGGGLLVVIIGPISFSGYGEIDPLLNSGIKVIIALLLIAVWITILSKVKNWVFHKQMKS